MDTNYSVYLLINWFIIYLFYLCYKDDKNLLILVYNHGYQLFCLFIN